MPDFEKIIIEFLEEKIAYIKEAEKKGESRGEKRGEKIGKKKGEKIGEKKGIMYVAQNMLAKNMEINEIQEMTGLSKKELSRLVRN